MEINKRAMLPREIRVQWFQGLVGFWFGGRNRNGRERTYKGL